MKRRGRSSAFDDPVARSPARCREVIAGRGRILLHPLVAPIWKGAPLMRRHADRPASSWLWLLALFTAAGLTETVFSGQMIAFTPLYLPRFGIAPADIPGWTGAIVAVSGTLGLPFLPFWGALADRYGRQPLIVRSFVAQLLAAVLAVLAGNIWVFVAGRALISLALGNTGLLVATLGERVPRGRLGLAFAVMNSAPPLGALVGPLIGGPVVDARGFRALLA